MAAQAAQTITGMSNSLHSAPASRLHPQHQACSSGPTICLGGSRGLNGRRRPGFSMPLAPLEVNLGKHQAFVHIQYVIKPGPHNDSLEPITVTVSTPLAVVAAVVSPPRKLDLADQEELKKDLGRLFKLPSPDRDDVLVAVDIKRHPYADLRVGDRWQDIHGANDWDGLIGEGTIDPVLRGELMRYGDFAQATYDAFDNDETSKNCGNAKYDKNSLLEEVGLLNRGYEIKEFIYATAEAEIPKFFWKSTVSDDEKWSKDSNFMGFVAVCTSPRELARLGRRDIVVAWRGTVTQLEWLENVRDFFSPTGMDPRAKDDKSVMVESGFLSVYKSKNDKSRYNKLSAREQALTAVRNLVQEFKDEELSITVTGHSLGSALSMICAYDIAESGINKRIHSPKVPRHWDEPQLDAVHLHPDHHKEPLENRVPVSVISFAGPRVGNSDFKARVEELGVKVFRVVEAHDIVPKVPGIIFNENLEFLHNFSRFLPDSYVHLGRELKLDSLASQFLKDTIDPINAHNLEAYLHLLDGYHGPGGRTSHTGRRDVALVNKASNFLEPRLGVPENWWPGKMVMDRQTQQWIVTGDVHALKIREFKNLQMKASADQLKHVRAKLHISQKLSI